MVQLILCHAITFANDLTVPALMDELQSIVESIIEHRLINVSSINMVTLADMTLHRLKQKSYPSLLSCISIVAHRNYCLRTKSISRLLYFSLISIMVIHREKTIQQNNKELNVDKFGMPRRLIILLLFTFS